MQLLTHKARTDKQRLCDFKHLSRWSEAGGLTVFLPHPLSLAPVGPLPTTGVLAKGFGHYFLARPVVAYCTETLKTRDISAPSLSQCGLFRPLAGPTANSRQNPSSPILRPSLHQWLGELKDRQSSQPLVLSRPPCRRSAPLTGPIAAWSSSASPCQYRDGATSIACIHVDSNGQSHLKDLPQQLSQPSGLADPLHRGVQLSLSAG